MTLLRNITIRKSSIGKFQVCHPDGLQSVTRSLYLAYLRSWDSWHGVSHGTVCSITTHLLLLSDISIISGRRVVSTIGESTSLRPKSTSSSQSLWCGIVLVVCYPLLEKLLKRGWWSVTLLPLCLYMLGECSQGPVKPPLNLPWIRVTLKDVNFCSRLAGFWHS